MKRILRTIVLSLLALPLGMSAATLSSGTIGKYSLLPEPGEVEDIKTICIKFYDLGWYGLQNNPDTSGIVLTCNDGTVYKVCDTKYDIDYESCTMSFSTSATGLPVEISSPGTYTLTIPENTFQRNRKPEMHNDLITATYTIAAPADNALTTYVCSPGANSSQNTLGLITVSFPDATSGVRITGESGSARLTYGNTVYPCVKCEVRDNAISLGFGLTEGGAPLTFKHPGEYSLHIPKGMVGTADSDATNNSPLTAIFHIDNPGFNPMSAFTHVPAENETVTSCSGVTIVFPDAIFGLDVPSDLSGIRLMANGASTEYMAAYPTLKAPYDNVSFSFVDKENGLPATLAESGNYVVTIPAGVFRESGTGYANEAMAIPFTILNPEDHNPFHVFTTMPEEGSPIGEIYELSITFPDVDEEGIEWPFDISKVTLRREGDETIYTGNSAMLKKGKTVITGFGTEGNTMSEKLHFRVPGDYVITIPAGVFSAGGETPVTNSPIELRYTVDPALNYTCKLTPASGTTLTALNEICLQADDALKAVGLNISSSEKALLTGSGTTIEVSATSDERGVVFTPVETPGLGEWTLTIPAGMLSGTTVDGIEIVNATPITASYSLKEPATYPFTISPEQEQTIPLFTKFVVSVLDKPKKVTLDTNAGHPILAGNDRQYTLTAKVSGTDVMFAVEGGAELKDGTYSINIPAGYIVTTDADKLTAPLPAIACTFSIKSPAPGDFAEGMFIYNEGWYGKDMASFTQIPASGPVRYNVFMEQNPTHSLGLTGTTAGQFADKIYAVCKQSGSNLSGIEGGVLTQLDAASMTFVDNIVSLDKGEQARSFCGVSATRGYLSTSAGIYPVNLETMTLGERFAAAETKLQHGQMLYYQGKVYASVKDWDLVVIDPEDDTMSDILTGPSVTTFVTPDGSLYTATLDESNPFYRIDPETSEIKSVEIKTNGYEGRSRIADIWRTWTPVPLAVDRTENIIYYATEPDASQIARLNLDNGEFTPDFIKLPETESGQQMIYGQGVATDPRTGEIVVTAVEKGYGVHYTRNFVYRVNPADGSINADRSMQLSEYYWFPSMCVFNGYKAPELDLTSVSLAAGNVKLNLHEHTRLDMGNKFEIEYTVESSDPEVCEVVKLGNGEYMLSPDADGSATISVTAAFRGLASNAEFTVSTSGTGSLAADGTETFNVFTPSGIQVLKDAGKAALGSLPKGLYIVNGKKLIVR